MPPEADDFATSSLDIPAFNDIADEEATLIAVPNFLTADYITQESSTVPINIGLYPGGGATNSSLNIEGGQINQVINYYFPVEIEVVGSASEDEWDSIAQYIYQGLNNALQDYNEMFT